MIDKKSSKCGKEIKVRYYLDYAATTPPSDAVKLGVTQHLEANFGNPSSLHRLGVQAEKHIKESRRILSKALGVLEREIIFTSGGTEANNLALFGVINKFKKGRLITTKIEHPSVLKVFEYFEKKGFDVVYLPVNEEGVVEVERLIDALTRDTLLVSIMHVNNEIGTIQPIKAIGQVIHHFNQMEKTDIKFHVDAVQGFGKIELDVKSSHIDLMTISAHKINGLKGTGALYQSSETVLIPRLYGGQQENGLRPGTENVLGIIAFGIACEETFLKRKQLFETCLMLKERMVQHLGMVEGFKINGRSDSPYILNLTFPGIKAEVLLHTLEMNGVYVSTGSACSSKKKSHSHVLKAIGLKDLEIEGSIRLSFGEGLDEKCIDEAAVFIKEAAQTLKQVMGKRNR